MVSVGITLQTNMILIIKKLKVIFSGDSHVNPVKRQWDSCVSGVLKYMKCVKYTVICTKKKIQTKREETINKKQKINNKLISTCS